MTKQKSIGVKNLLLVKDKDTWMIRYDQDNQSISVAGPEPQGEQLHEWLTSRKHVAVSEKGDLVAIFPVQSWHYLEQVIEKDLYKDFGMRSSWERP